MKTYTVDKNGRKEELDWYDFITNDNNPILKRLGKELEEDPEFQRIMRENGFTENEKE